MTFDIYAYVPNELFGSEMPETEEDLLAIKDLEIKVIISLDENITALKQKSPLLSEFEHHEIFITDFDIPNNEQIEQILSIVEKAKMEKKAVLLHCLAGCGRTGLVLAIIERFIYKEKNGKKAIEKVRKIRPCALETKTQEDFVIYYQRN